MRQDNSLNPSSLIFHPILSGYIYSTTNAVSPRLFGRLGPTTLMRATDLMILYWDSINLVRDLLW